MRLHYLSLFLLSIVLFSCSSGTEYDLKYRPKPNTRYAFKNVTTMNMDQKMMGQSMKMDQEIVYDGIYEVGSMSADSSYDVTLTYTHMSTKQTMKAPMEKVTSFDSDLKDTTQEDTGSELYDQILNQPMKMKVSKDGKVLSFSGMYEAIKKAMKSTTDSKLSDELVGQFTDDNMKGTIEYIFRLYPESKVNVGADWEIEQKYEAGYPMLIQSKYTFNGEKNGRAMLSSTGTIKTNKGGKGLSSMMAKMIELSGDQTATIELDLKTGLPLVNTSNLTIKGEMNMMGAKFPISMKSTTKVTLTPIN